MPNQLSYRYSWVLRYAAAPAAVGVGLLLRLGLTALVGEGLPTYITFYPVIMAVALLGGFGPGLLATACAVLVADCWLLEPRGLFTIEKLSDAVGLAFFAGMGLFMTVVAELFRRSLQRRAVSAAESVRADVPASPWRPLGETMLLVGGLILSLLILGVIGAQTYRDLAATAQADLRVSHTYLVDDQLEHLFSTVEDMEASERGYLIMGQEDYLRPYDLAKRALAGHLAALKRLTQTNPSRAQGLAAIEALVNAKLAEFKQVIEVRHREGLEAAQALMATGKGQAVTEELRQRVTEAEDEDQRLLQARTMARDTDLRRTRESLLAGGVFSFLLLTTVFLFLKQENNRRRQAERDLRQHQADLERTVLARTADLSRANDSLRESRAKLEAALASMTDAVFISDAVGRFVEVNDAFATFHRFKSKAECMRRLDDYPAILEVFTANGEPAPLEQWAVPRALRGETVSYAEYTLRRKDTGETWVGSYSFGPIRDKDGAIAGSVVVGRDITERKRTEEAVRHLNAELRERVLQLEAANAALDASRQAAVKLMEDALQARKQAEAANTELRESRERLAAFAATTFEGIVLSQAGRIQDCNEQFAQMLGRAREEIIGRTIADFALAEDRERVMGNIHAGRESVIEQRMLRADGSQITVEAHGRPGQGRSGLRYTAIRDITARKQRERQLQQLNRTLTALKNSSLAMLRATSETEYLHEVCAMIVADCGHAMVWVGYAEPDDARTIRPAAHAGFETGFLQTLDLTWADTERGRGPTGTAIRTGQPCVCPNMLTDPRFTPWRQEALQRGYASSLALPLLAEGRAFGAITIYSQQPDPFSEDEVKLLTQLADDVSYCLGALRLRIAKAQADLERDKFVSLADNSTVFVGMCGLDFVPFYVNDAGLRMVGLDSLDAARRTPVSEFFFPEDREQILADFLPRVLREGRAEIEVRFRHFKTGEALWMLYNVFHIRDARGHAVGLATVSRNITDRRQAEQRAELLASTASQLLTSDSPQRVVEQLCHRVLSFLDCQVFFNYLVDDGTERLRLNACGGIPSAQRGRLEWLDYGGAVCGCVARDACRIVAEDIQANPDPRTELVRSFGVQAYACHPLLVGGRVFGTLSFGTRTRARFTSEELSLMKAIADQVAIAMERERAQAALQKANEDLKRSNRDLEQFAYVASHDLQEPLRAVGGYVKLLQLRFAHELNAKARGYIEGAFDGATRMERLITDLLAFSRVSTRGDTIAPASLEAALGQALRNLEANINSSHVTVTHDPLPTLPVDASQVRQVFQNLVGNAIKFRGEAPPRIHIGAQRQDGRWVLSVEDNGIGIEPQYFERIFQIFQRLHTRKRYPGTGIGLAICKKIVERHGGTIWVESQLGHGSTFYFSLPEAVSQ